MLITILLSQGGRFTLDIGEDGMDAATCVAATRDLLASEELLHGGWGSSGEHNALTVAYINPVFVAGIYAS